MTDFVSAIPQKPDFIGEMIGAGVNRLLKC
jgi:hypothetical protein